MAKPVFHEIEGTLRIEGRTRSLRRALTREQLRMLLNCAEAGLADFEASTDRDAQTAGELAAIIADARGSVK